MDALRLQVVTLDGLMYDEEVKSVLVRTVAGDVSILKNHIDYVSTIEVGRVKITTEKETKEAACAGGFISVSENVARIVATTFEFAEDIDKKRAEKAKKKAEIRLNEKKSDTDMKIAEIKLKKALLRLNVSNKK